MKKPTKKPLVKLFVNPDGILVQSSNRGDHYFARNRRGVELTIEEIEKSLYDLFNSKKDNSINKNNTIIKGRKEQIGGFNV